MREDMELRMVKTAEYIIDNKSTVRDAAKQFGVSKSTVHKDMRDRLRMVDAGLFREVLQILAQNKAERHMRGGIATREKYKNVGKIHNMSIK